jgi:tetratricopeptide (TPR) repeat protein
MFMICSIVLQPGPDVKTPPCIGWLQTGMYTDMLTPSARNAADIRWRDQMDIWGALQYVGTGLSLVAFVVAAILFAYRARLKNRAEIIKSAPEKERLEAIAATAEFFRVDVSGLSRAQQQDIVLTQIHARARRDLLLGVVTLIVAVLLAIVATVAILTSKGTAPSTLVVNPSGPVIAPGGVATFEGPVTFGPDEKTIRGQIAAAQKPLEDRLERILAITARDRGVEIAPLRATLIKLGEAGVRDEDIAKRLDEKADELIKLREDIGKLRQGPPELASFAQQAEALIDQGGFDGARAVLAAGRAAARSVREQSSRYEAQFLAQEAKVDDLQLAYRNAAQKYAEAAALVAPFDRDGEWQYALGQASELSKLGDEFGNKQALEEAIGVYRRALTLAPRSQQPLDWATTQNNLGEALVRLGERDSGTARLEEAVAAYRAAPEEMTRVRVPLDWATTQMNLGAALQTLGERESGTARLEEAVAAFRAALEERTRARVPLDWARTQVNLGTALTRLGERESGTARLKEAVAA